MAYLIIGWGGSADNAKNFQLRDALTHCNRRLSQWQFSQCDKFVMLVPAFFMLNVYDKAVGQPFTLGYSH